MAMCTNVMCSDLAGRFVQEFEEELFMATRKQKSGKIFHGWWIVLVAGIALSVHSAPIMGRDALSPFVGATCGTW